MPLSNSLPDNLIGRLTRVHVANKTFKNSEGQNVEYSRLVLSGTVKGKDFVIETKLEQKDITLLELSDTESERQALNAFTLGQE
jgi:hypothetical protein